MIELGEAVVDRLGLSRTDPLQRFQGDVERWMSHLATDQPWLTDSENLHNRALFIEASEAVRDCIEAAETLATQFDPPEWLLRLVLHWSYYRCPIITFNYDLLIERAVRHLRLCATLGDLYGISITSRHPPGTALAFSAGRPAKDLLTLYKLHGSVNWLYNGLGAPPTDPITLSQELNSWQTSTRRPYDDSWEDDAWRHSPGYRFINSGLQPLIVPPAGTKNDFYKNRALRAQWSHASKAIGRSSGLTVMGFSFPASDSQVRDFLTSSFTADRLSIVDYNSKAVDRPKEFMRADTTIEQHFAGASALPDYVGNKCGQILRWTQLQPDAEGAHRVLINCGDEQYPLLLDTKNHDPVSAVIRLINQRWPRAADRSTFETSGKYFLGEPVMGPAYLAYLPKHTVSSSM
ncbi:hypothetical protein Kfla_2177 [Kribbella flavida DSM 17836]|uniref:SIR2-like domain-containing protein n=1 Tax=Kribbella flavida (strain DSM 17836 / JCM 10339 / NBRC 14399) TaxID=479435 RepID=D2PSD2_KRIFD|nr:hypothetical protein [Kribbella flavida]ADB31256.1 hypothetical protein Kfla_2177 [Kribbella flavida DSM 17836]